MIKRCNNGHWYDDSVEKSCPHCRRQNEKLGIGMDNIEEDDHTVSIVEAEILMPDVGRTKEEDDRTISFGFFGLTAVQPVTGWLVCMTGEGRGRDYRLHMGKNFVGRSPSMDVALVDDKSISREKHCSVIYDPREDMFYVSAEGGNLVYLNDELVESSRELKEDDRITVGDTNLIFIPFSRGKRKWEEE